MFLAQPNIWVKGCMRDLIHEGCVCQFVCKYVHRPDCNMRVCSGLLKFNCLKSVSAPFLARVFTLCVVVRASAAVHAGALTYLCPPGDDAKNMWLLKPSGVWAASVCSPLPSLWPSLLSLHYSSSLHPSRNYTLSQTHIDYTQLCPCYTTQRMTSARRERDKRGQWKGERRGGRTSNTMCKDNIRNGLVKDSCILLIFLKWDIDKGLWKSVQNKSNKDKSKINNSTFLLTQFIELKLLKWIAMKTNIFNRRTNLYAFFCSWSL